MFQLYQLQQQLNLGVGSNQIEVGATGTISYTSSRGSNERNWVFVDMDMNYPHFPNKDLYHQMLVEVLV